MSKILQANFFKRPTSVVARELLGKFLVRKLGNGGKIELMINELEAYDGFKDKASHAHRGMTARNKVMFGPGGFWYVYFCYGVHWMLNIVTGVESYPAAILIRGAGNVRGPGRLTKFLGVEGKLNCTKADLKSGLWVEDRGVEVPENSIKKTPRIGVAYAGPVWAKKAYRFLF